MIKPARRNWQDVMSEVEQRIYSRQWQPGELIPNEADLAIELLHITEVAEFLGHEINGALECCTDSKAAYDLCHRFTSTQNTRHVDRKLFKMRELRGAKCAVVGHMPTSLSQLIHSPRDPHSPTI